MNFEKLFDPKSVAVIGASSEKNKVGYAILKNLLDGGKRAIYPVNPSGGEILGLSAFPSVLKIAGGIDLAIIAVRADLVPRILEECGKKKVSFAVVISSGFKETGSDGEKLEKKVKDIATHHKINLLGPNCLGVFDSSTNLNATFATQKPRVGGIALLSQSGALGSAMIDWACGQGVGFSKFISLGNEAQMNELDFLDHLSRDPDTKAVLIYLEKVSDGRRFVDQVSRLSAKKPVVILKAGRSGKGQAAVMSHTGSLAPEESIFTTACKQSGAVLTGSICEFFHFAKLLDMKLPKPLRRLAVLTNGGGPSIVAADLIELSHSLELARLKDETKSALKKVLPPMAAVNNPVDIIGDALADRYEAALKILVTEKNIDAILAILTPQMMTEVEKTAQHLVRYSKQKPIIPIFMGGGGIKAGVDLLQRNKLGNFICPDAVIQGLDTLAREKPKANQPEALAIKKTGSKNKMLGFADTSKILHSVGLKVEGNFAKNKNSLPRIFAALHNHPAAMKISSQDIIHKTESRALKLNIKNTEEAEKIWVAMVKSLNAKNRYAKIDGMLIQPMFSGKEVIIGMKRDPVFGPIIVFGLGGIFTEALKDTSMRIAPINPAQALKMMGEIKGTSILKGLRGEKKVNLNALAKIIVAISKLAISRPEIEEIDLNPVIVNEKTAAIVDARIIVA